MPPPLRTPNELVRPYRADVDPLEMGPYLRKMLEDQPRPPGFDEARHRLVALASTGTVVGYADIWKPIGSECAELTMVCDQESDQPFGAALTASALVADSVANATAQGASSLLAYVAADDKRLTDLLLKYGFERGSGYRRMRIELDTAPEAPFWPRGQVLRSFDELADTDMLVDACNDCYAGLWGHKHASREDAEAILAAFPHDGILILTDTGDRVVGTCKATTAPSGADGFEVPIGHIDAPGLAAPFRDRLYLYSALVRAALVWLYGRKHRQVLLETWGDPEGVLQTYQELGFTTEVDVPAYLFRIET